MASGYFDIAHDELLSRFNYFMIISIPYSNYSLMLIL